MKRIHPFLILFILFSIQIAITQDKTPLSVEEIVRLAKEGRERQRGYVKDYTCFCVEELRILDKKGKIKHQERVKKRVYTKGDLTHDEVVSILKKDELLSEKEIKERQKEIDKEERKKGKEEDSRGISPFEEKGEGKFEINLVREDSLGGRSAYVLSVNPKKKGKELLKGLYWIDKQNFRILKSELSPSKNPKFVKEMNIFIDFVEIEQGIFLPETFRIKGRGGFLFFKSNFEMKRTCQNYELNVGLKDEMFPELQAE